MRLIGPLLVVTLVCLCLGQRQSTVDRSRRLIEGEERSLSVLGALQRAALRSFKRGDRPDLVTIARDAGLPQLVVAASAELGSIACLADRDYLYALGYVRRRNEDGSAPSDGFVIRSWPLKIGVTGDLERHVDDLSHLWEGQNTIGRSGLDRGFPPPFPEPDLAEASSRWWRRPFSEALADQPDRAQR